jgi:hypothetical protein
MGYKIFLNLNFLFYYVLYLINMFRILGLITSLDEIAIIYVGYSKIQYPVHKGLAGYCNYMHQVNRLFNGSPKANQ